MNTLSSLLNWIGNTIGANPNTLTTTSKKIVGAINEVDGKADTALSRQSITVTAASTTTGAFVSSHCYRCGNIVWFSATVRNTAAVAAGSNIYQGTLSANLPRPYAFISGAGYFGSHSIVGSVNESRALVVRNSSSSAVTIGSSGSVTITFTYITQD